jgi:hypothetical protein
MSILFQDIGSQRFLASTFPGSMTFWRKNLFSGVGDPDSKEDFFLKTNSFDILLFYFFITLKGEEKGKNKGKG